jgi:hypothetical protein
VHILLDPHAIPKQPRLIGKEFGFAFNPRRRVNSIGLLDDGPVFRHARLSGTDQLIGAIIFKGKSDMGMWKPDGQLAGFVELHEQKLRPTMLQASVFDGRFLESRPRCLAPWFAKKNYGHT